MPTMCLLVLAWMKHPRYRLVIAANRDEFHDRPAAPLAWWSGDAPVLAGRDLVAGGTWMGVTRPGRFGAVTNFRDPKQILSADAPSRGSIVPRFLTGDAGPAEFVRHLRESAAGFAGFNVIVGGPRALYYFSNRIAAAPRRLDPGVYGLSNHQLDSPWPKLVKARTRLAAAVSGGEPEVTALRIASRRMNGHCPTRDCRLSWSAPRPRPSYCIRDTALAAPPCCSRVTTGWSSWRKGDSMPTAG
jgi:uncharacterized protein with NRDE domain